MTAAAPTFSVIVPCRDYARFLPSSLQSVLAQGREDVEIIVVDDASSDDTSEVAGSFGDPVRVIRLEQNAGAGGAWGIGLSAARGRYLCRLDADDWQLPGFLDRVEAEFEDDQRVGLVAGGVYLYRDGEAGAFVHAPVRQDTFLDEVELRRKLLRKYFFRMPAAAMRRAVIVGHDPPRRDLQIGEDWEYFLRVLRRWRGRVLPDPYAVNRLHDVSLTATSFSAATLRAELGRLLALTRDPNDPAYLSEPERRVFALGVAESYLGTVGLRMTTRDLVSSIQHLHAAARLAACQDVIMIPALLRYLIWGGWQRLVVRPRRERVPVEALRP